MGMFGREKDDLDGLRCRSRARWSCDVAGLDAGEGAGPGSRGSSGRGAVRSDHRLCTSFLPLSSPPVSSLPFSSLPFSALSLSLSLSPPPAAFSHSLRYPLFPSSSLPPTLCADLSSFRRRP
eukprot:247361-Rhodomonas_salina.5